MPTRRSPSHKVHIGSLRDNLTEAQWDGVIAGIYQYARETRADPFHLDRTMDRVKEIKVIENMRMKGFGLGGYKTIEIASYVRKYPDEWLDTLLHEAAHIIDEILGDGKGHGPTWKRIAALVGAKPERCGPNLPENRTDPAKRTQVEYTCSDCGAKWTRSRRFSEPRVHGACKDKPGRGSLVLTKHPQLAAIRRGEM